MNSRALGHVLAIIYFLTQLIPVSSAQSGTITTVAGNGTPGFSGDGGLATVAQFNGPSSVVVDSNGNFYVADSTNNRIRKVTAAGVITTVAGGGAKGLGDRGPAVDAELSMPFGVALDRDGNLYIADRNNNRVRKVTLEGVITTVAGGGTGGLGDGGPATKAQLWMPTGVAVDSQDNLYIADSYNNRVRKVTAATGVITTIAGNGTEGFGGDGGLSTAARLWRPSGVAIDFDGNLYIADSYNYRIRRVTATRVISTVAGNGTAGAEGDGSLAALAQLDRPAGVAVDSEGNLYISDSNNERIRKVMADTGVITTIAGNGSTGSGGDGGPATVAQLNHPASVALDSDGNLYIADFLNYRIRRVVVSTPDIFFPQVAIGGGYSTLFTITNTGETEASGNLILTDQLGNPLYVSAILTDSMGVTQPAFSGSAFPLTVPSGGSIFLTVAGLTMESPLQTGWGRVEIEEGKMSGVATYEFVVGAVMQTMVGVLHTKPLDCATIPADNSQGRQVAYAIANPGSRTITVKVALVGQDGKVVDDSLTITLDPGKQVARYLWQDLGNKDFKGSVVFRGQGGVTFIAVALAEKQGFTTVIPLIPEKAPGVPD